MGRTSSTFRLGLALVAQGRGRLKNTREPGGLQATKRMRKWSVMPPPLIELPTMKSVWRGGEFGLER